MQQRKEKQKIKTRKNDNNKNLISWCLICGHWFARARGCCCFNSFYIFLKFLGGLKALILKGSRTIKVRNIMRKVRNIMPKVRDLMRKVRNIMCKSEKYNALKQLKVRDLMLEYHSKVRNIMRISGINAFDFHF